MTESVAMKRVIIESPLRGDYEANRRYAKACMRDSLQRNEAPFASHLLYAQDGILDDADEEQRLAGMQAGFLWGRQADLVAVYTDLGISEGMQRGVEVAEAAGIPITYRSGIEVPPEEEDPSLKEQQKILRAMLESMFAEPDGTRFAVISIAPDTGDMSQRVYGGFQVWELMGIARFLDTQFRLAANKLLITQEQQVQMASDEEPTIQ